MNGNTFIKEIGRSFLISSFLPAVVFVYLATFLFNGFLPQKILVMFKTSEDLFGSNWVFAIIFTLWIAFGLYSSQHWTVQLFEGYKFDRIFFVGGCFKKISIAIHKRRFEKELPAYFTNARNLVDKGASKKRKKKLSDVKDLAFAQLQSAEVLRPFEDNDLLPTRLGNVFRASEYYPSEKYHLEGISIFPKLFHVLPQPFLDNLEEFNNRFIFLLNSSLLTYLLGIASVFVGLLGLILSTYRPLNQNVLAFFDYDRGLNTAPPFFHLSIGIAFFIIGYIIYRISIHAAVELNLHFRSGYDLYRFELLKKLNHPIPKTLKDERKYWKKLSEFFVAGNRLRFPRDNFQFVYQFDEKETKKNKDN